LEFKNGVFPVTVNSSEGHPPCGGFTGRFNAWKPKDFALEDGTNGDVVILDSIVRHSS